MISSLPLAAAAVAAPAVIVGGDTFVLFDHPVAALDAPLVLNFEGSLCPDGRGAQQQQDRSWRLCADRRRFDVLVRLGARAVHVQNNHAADGGARGIAQARAELERDGITVIDDEAWTFGRGAEALVFVAWHDATGPPAGITDRLLTITAGRPVVLVHWSETRALSERRRIARRLVDAGATVVIGSGSHRIGPVERIGPAVVFYDVGDLVLDCDCSISRVGLLVTLKPGGLPLARPIRVAHRPGDRVAEPAANAREIRALIEDSARLGTDLVLVDGSLAIMEAGLSVGRTTSDPSPDESRPSH